MLISHYQSLHGIQASVEGLVGTIDPECDILAVANQGPTSCIFTPQYPSPLIELKSFHEEITMVPVPVPFYFSSQISTFTWPLRTVRLSSG
jgi:hypothetical protein